MAQKVLHISKHIIKRVIIGVLTGVVGFSTIYFLGFNKTPTRPSEAEMRKNTIRTWKSYVELENNMAVKRDTLFKKLNKMIIGMQGHRNEDSVIRHTFMDKLETLKKTPVIDKMLYLLLSARIRYGKGAWENYVAFYTRYMAIQDSSVDQAEKNDLIQELNTDFTNGNNNFTDRLGHTIEDMAIALAKKYKYPFSIAELTLFNPYYQNLKKINREDVKKYIEAMEPEDHGQPGQGNPG